MRRSPPAQNTRPFPCHPPPIKKNQPHVIYLADFSLIFPTTTKNCKQFSHPQHPTWPHKCSQNNNCVRRRTRRTAETNNCCHKPWGLGSAHSHLLLIARKDYKGSVPWEKKTDQQQQQKLSFQDFGGPWRTFYWGLGDFFLLTTTERGEERSRAH